MTEQPQVRLEITSDTCLHCVLSEIMMAMQKAGGPMELHQVLRALGEIAADVISSTTTDRDQELKDLTYLVKVATDRLAQIKAEGWDRARRTH